MANRDRGEALPERMMLKQQAERKPLTLLYSAHDEKFNQAAALCEMLTKSPAKKSSRSKKPA
jgi:uncharacterized protein YeaO (DUF488 family)